MNYTIKAKKLGRNWYLDVDHIDPSDILLNNKISKVFNLIDKNSSGELTIVLNECYSIIEPNTIFINDDDLLNYFTTTDDINIRFYINDHEFYISDCLYNLLECQFNPNFHKTVYTIEILNWTN